MLHGVHHDYPNDSMRLEMPVGFSLPLAAVFYWLIVLIPGYAAVVPFFAGFVFGYFSYNMLHFATDHAKFIKAKWFQKLRKQLIDHHFKAPGEGFGLRFPI